MKFECERASFLEALSAVFTAVPSQSATQVSSDVFLQCNEKGLKLQNTDLSIFIEILVLELKNITPGEALVPVKRLFGLTREISDETLMIERDKDLYSVQIKAGEDNFQIAGHDPEDFPEPPTSAEANPFVMKKKSLLDAFQKVSFAASRDPSKEQLQGVSCIFEGEKAYFIATDTKRLTKYTVELEEAVEKRREGIIPLRAVEVIEKFLTLGGGDGEVNIFLSSEAQQIVIRHERGQVLCRLLQGKMPDYLSLIPNEFVTTVEIKAKDLLTAVRKAAVLTTKEQFIISFNISRDFFSINVSSQDVGSGKVIVEGAKIRGEDISVKYTVPFVVDGLRVLGDMPIQLNFKKEGAMAVMCAGDFFSYAFMKVKLKNYGDSEEE